MSPALLREILRYGIATAASAGLSLGLPLALHWSGLPPRLAAALGLVSALAVNFLVTRFFVFRRGRGLRRDLPMYLATLLGFRGLEYGAFLLLFGPLALPYALALALPLVVSSLTKFAVYRWLVFAPGRRPPAPVA